jgi:hypothetical protein
MFESARRGLTKALIFAAVSALAMVAWQGARADRIGHPIAVFSGLDKITGRIIAFEVATDETVQFGSLQITERACYTRPATETPQTTTFIEVDEVDAANEYKRIFSGWMFAASPGLHGVEHPVYDIWLTDCKGAGEVVANPETSEPEPAPTPPPPEQPAKASPQQKRPRRAQPVEEPAAAPPLDQGPIEVGPPPGLIPAPSGGRRPPAQRYYPTAPDDGRDQDDGSRF